MSGEAVVAPAEAVVVPAGGAGVPAPPGARRAARTTGGEVYPLTVCEIHDDKVVVDLNHPLAGKALHFDVRVEAVRAAGTEEMFTGKPRSIEIV